MARFRPLTQRDLYSCGPIAVMNALRWSGKRVPYGDLGKYKRMCRHKKDLGSLDRNIDKVLRRASGIRVRFRNGPRADVVDSWLRGGGAVVFSFNHARTSEKRVCRHVVLITRVTRKSYVTHNLSKGVGTKLWPKRSMHRYMREDGYVWLVSREEKK